MRRSDAGRARAHTRAGTALLVGVLALSAAGCASARTAEFEVGPGGGFRYVSEAEPRLAVFEFVEVDRCVLRRFDADGRPTGERTVSGPGAVEVELGAGDAVELENLGDTVLVARSQLRLRR